MDRSNILHEMKALCDAAGVDRKKVFPHNLRHLFACLFYQKEKRSHPACRSAGTFQCQYDADLYLCQR